MTKFLGSTKSRSPTPNTGTTSVPPLGSSPMYIKSIDNIQGPNNFVSFERTIFYKNQCNN